MVLYVLKNITMDIIEKYIYNDWNFIGYLKIQILRWIL